MTLILEDGSGVKSANSYVDSAFVLAYLTARNRQTENSWDTIGTAATDAACIAATDHIELIHARKFKGSKFWTDLSKARAAFTLTGQPADAETVTIGSTVYTFNTALGGAFSVLIGSSANATLENLLYAIEGNEDQEGLTIGVGTTTHPNVTADASFGDVIYAEANDYGTAGNSIASTDTVTNGSWNFATLSNGSDDGAPQRLSFPRANLYVDGILIQGIPYDLKAACAEYAVRALASPLIGEAVTNNQGAIVTKSTEKVGPIEDTKEYLAGTAFQFLITPVPAADRLLRQYTGGGQGGVIR